MTPCATPRTLAASTAVGLVALVAAAAWGQAPPVSPPEFAVEKLGDISTDEARRMAVEYLCAALTAEDTNQVIRVRFGVSGLTDQAAGPEAPEDMRRGHSLLLAGALSCVDDTDARRFLLEQLQLVGGPEVVVPVSRLLADPGLASSAAGTLRVIGAASGDPRVPEALRAALAVAPDEMKEPLVRSLGVLRDAPSLPAILEASRSTNPALRWSSLRALAHMGDPAAAKVLVGAVRDAEPAEQAKVNGLALLYARRLARGGHREDGAALCRSIFRSSTAPEHGTSQCNALYTLYEIEGLEALDELLSALKHENIYLRDVAAGLLRSAPGEDVTRSIASQLEADDPSVRAGALKVLVTRADRSAYPAAQGALGDADPQVRQAAIGAVAALGGVDALEPLLNLLDGEEKTDRMAAQEALSRLDGAQVGERLTAEFRGDASADLRVALLQVLARRPGSERTALLLAAVEDHDKKVRKAAVKALKPVAEESDLQRLLELHGRDDLGDIRKGLAGAMVAVAGYLEEDERAAPFVSALSDATGEHRAGLHRVLAKVGGPGALTAIVTDTTYGDDEVSESAIRVLAGWKTFDATEPLLQVAGDTQQEDLHVLALRGYLRLVNEKYAEGEADEARAFYLAALEVVRRDEERTAVQGHLDKLRPPEEPEPPVAALPAGLETIGGWKPLFDGESLTGWEGDAGGYQAGNGELVCTSKGGLLYTSATYGDFVVDVEFKLSPGANNGLGIRSPREGNPAYAGMELQILDNEAEQYADLKEYQYHGSVYGVVPAERGHLKPVGEWNRQQVICIGDHIKVILNGTTIVDAYLAGATSIDGKEHPGLQRRQGRIVLCGHSSRVAFRNLRIREYAPAPPIPATAADNTAPEGFEALFNGSDLTGWKGLVGNPKTRASMNPEQLAQQQERADEAMRTHWRVEDGMLVFDGKGKSLCTDKDYGDFDFYVDWKIPSRADSGIYLRGSPQLQIWDPANEEQWRHGAEKGSGALWNNQKSGSRPLVKADRPIGEWNTFYVRMVGERVDVYLNGQQVLDHVVMENYWERDKPIYRTGQIELQNHGSALFFKNIYLRQLPY